ncbi:MAG TPA: DedA family protein [Acidimicrobiia bacterium]|nr:DedA family protein [Acidimicrobiia bacterium]
MTSDLLEMAGGWPDPVLYLIVGMFAFFGATVILDILLPGEIAIVFFAAAFADANVAVPPAIVACVAGALIGDSLSWYLGQRFGWSLICRWKFIRKRAEGPAQRAHEHFAERGAWIIFVARFVGVLRAAVPFVLGSTKMRYGKFMAYDVPAAIVWSTGIVLLGYWIGPPAARFLDRFGWITGAIAVVGVVAWFAVKRIKRAGSTRPQQTTRA